MQKGSSAESAEEPLFFSIPSPPIMVEAMALVVAVAVVVHRASDLVARACWHQASSCPASWSNHPELSSSASR